MENRLNEIAERMTEEDTIRFEHSFSDFDDHSVLGNEQHDRILSSLMRKAGFEMKETMSVKKTRKHGKFIGLVIAAAVLMTGALGVYAADTLGIFSRFFKGDISPFESEVLSTVQTVSNEDLTLTIDGIVADEVECKILVSVYANDSEGRKIIKRLEKDPGEDEDYYHGNSQLFLEHHGFDYQCALRQADLYGCASRSQETPLFSSDQSCDRGGWRWCCDCTLAEYCREYQYFVMGCNRFWIQQPASGYHRYRLCCDSLWDDPRGAERHGVQKVMLYAQRDQYSEFCHH